MNYFGKYRQFYIFFKTLFIFQSIYIVNSELLNNIIRLGDDNFRYSHFSFNSNGDMIVDSSAYPANNKRNFYGLKKNGRFYFNDINNQLPGYYSMEVDHTKGRIEGESYFIKLSSSNTKFQGRELILGISRNGDNDSGYFTEIYNLKNNNFTKYSTTNMFGHIISDSFTIIKNPDTSDSNYYYTLAYIIKDGSEYKLKIKKTYFSFDLPQGYKHVIEKEKRAQYSRSVSSFYTEKLIFICFYINGNKHLRIRAYSSDFLELCKKNINEEYDYEYNIFLKGIHLKGEVGIFIYFKENINYPTILILQYNDNKSLTSYTNYEEINFDKTTFIKENMLNDIVRLNNYQICYISVSTDKEYFKFVILTLYKSDTLINIKYYQIEMYNTYKMKIFLTLKASIYNDFIALSFSHCPKSSCSSPYSDKHYASLIIFNYPNSENSNLDIIPLLYSTNKKIENDFSFNFEGKIIIENNLFGFVYKGTKIMKCPNNLYLTNTTNKNIILNESIILKNENVSLYFSTHENYEKKNYIIEYAYVLEESDYNTANNNNYITYIDDTLGNKIEYEKNYYKYNEYTGKSSDFTIIISNDLTTNCNNDLCSLCFSNFTCVTCIYNYTFNGNEKKCIPKPTIPTTIITTIPTTIQTTNLIIQEMETINPSINGQEIITTIQSSSNSDNIECTEKQILEGKCNGKMSNEQIKEVYNKLKSKISSNTNEIIETENVKFQISTIEEQKNNNNPNISSIDLGKCEELLKEQEGLSENDNLIILKTDIKNEDLSKTYVQYEIYNPVTYQLVSMEVCGDIPISVSVPINLDENTKSIYDSLSNSGYNLFDLNDSFYNDICSTYTTENGTDLTLADRKHLLYDNNGNISLCQDDCIFQSYNLTTKKAKCDCSVQVEETITDVEKIKFDKNQLVNSFYTTLTNSNFLVLKCYKLVFSEKGQKKNIGSYLMSGITLVFIILMLIYIINGNKKLNYFIQSILKQKLNNKSPYKTSDIKLFKTEKSKENKIITTYTKTIKNKNKYLQTKNIPKSKFANNKNLNKNKNKPLKILKKRKNTNFPPKKRINFITINKNKRNSYNEFVSSSTKSQIKIKKRNKLLEIKTKKNNKVEKNKRIITNIPNIKKNYLDTSKNVPKINKKSNLEELNDEELNNLEYEIALILDKRTYFQYYYSLLKKKQLILFAFYPSNDYNLISVKISLLLLSFSLYFTINGFFFSDATMNKINEDKGEYNFLFQIPQILYSTLVSSVINMILKTLSLSEKQILMIKSEKDYLISQMKSNKIKTCLKIKLISFFILSFILMIFFWYFISSFCAVYKNTQIILIEDTLVSFALSMIYPFGLNLLPGIFRIPALKAVKKDKNCLYKASKLIALI